ncbi:MAG: class I SAM-dependent methyltransferase [Phycisphaerae bacterium]|nr:class I SAM-dependent methyltransferase [Phycisphaerae bacterium]
MIRYFDKNNNRLVYVGKAANDAYWDQHWKVESSKLKKQIRVKDDRFIIGYTQKYLPPGTKILEGGCGMGCKVSALDYNGYDAYGVDYAKETIEKVNQYAPELKVKVGDVRDLQFPDNFFDGYWSLGVIEHFYDGYEKIVSEIFRVLKPGGYLFLTVPVISPLRRVKIKRGKYPEYKESEEMRGNFYQFAFEPRHIINDLKSKGFSLVDVKPCDGIKGLKDEISILKPFLQYLYDKRGRAAGLARKILDVAFRRFANHVCLFVMRKAETNWS